MTPAMKDDLMYQVGGTLEAALNSKWGSPLMSQAPALGAK